MLEAVLAGAGTDGIEDVEVVVQPALAATAVDVLGADGYLLGTPANIGYMSGALKHFFDMIYYPCLTATQRRPYALYVHGNSDTGGRGAGGRVHRHRAGLAAGPAAGHRAGRCQARRPRGMLGTGRHDGRGTGHVILTVALNASLHVSYETQHVAWGAANHVGRMFTRAGGGGLTVARVLTGLGEEVVAAGFAGGGAADLIEADLARQAWPPRSPGSAMSRAGWSRCWTRPASRAPG